MIRSVCECVSVWVWAWEREREGLQERMRERIKEWVWEIFVLSSFDLIITIRLSTSDKGEREREDAVFNYILILLYTESIGVQSQQNYEKVPVKGWASWSGALFSVVPSTVAVVPERVLMDSASIRSPSFSFIGCDILIEIDFDVYRKKDLNIFSISRTLPPFWFWPSPTAKHQSEQPKRDGRTNR